ncbi:hypothetical protein SUGI_0913970 [Cryptomeria japonica]|nr:hypothetical protein SUGI_0913970 [Cryptomeria japonica]
MLLLPHCASLSHDGLILLKIRKVDWRDTSNALSNWNESHQNPCAWNGISCDAFNTVTSVDIIDALISGNLTSAICTLPNLTALTLQGNAFSGPFPNALLHYKRLRKLDLSSNHFAGMFPAHIFQLSELRILNLAHNAFSGSVPLAFGTLPKLEALFLHENSLSGTFPMFIGNLESLTNFAIGRNPLLPGLIPRELGNLKQLQVLSLESSLGQNSDQFNGSLKFENTVYLSQQLVIPWNIGQLTSLSEMDCGHNQLQGTIPTAIGNVTYLSLPQLRQSA